MTNDEYHELVEFLAGRFERIDQRFERIDQRFERIDQRFERIDQRFEGLETRLTRVEVLGEENRGLIRTVAEGVTGVDRRLESFRGEVEERFRSLEEQMQVGFRSVREELWNAVGAESDRRERADGALEGRVSSLELRVERPEGEGR